MKNTLVYVGAAVVVGVIAGVAVGYWEARPWTVVDRVATKSSEAAHDHASDGKDAAADSEPGKPHASAPESIFRFGNMESGTVQRHTFPLRNDGKEPLTVNYVSHTCKCTKVQFDGAAIEPGAIFTVPPGEEAGITLEWAAKVPPGPFRHGAAFTTNDAKLERVELTVEGEIVSSTTLEPSRLDFGSAHVGRPATAEMVVMAFLESKVEVLSYEVVDEKLAERMTIAIEPLRFDQLPNPQAKAAVKVIATYDPKGTLGPFGGSLKLKTNLKLAPVLEVPIIGTVVGDISIFGSSWNEPTGLLRMAPVTSAKGGASRLFVNIRGDYAATTELSVKSVEPKELKVTLGEPQKLRENLIRVPLSIEIPPGTRPMAHMGDDLGGEGEIVLATTHPDTSSVRLRVYFTVQP